MGKGLKFVKLLGIWKYYFLYLSRSDLWGMKEYYDESMKGHQERRAELERKAGRDVTGEPRPKRRRLDDGTERIEMELRFIRYSTS